MRKIFLPDYQSKSVLYAKLEGWDDGVLIQVLYTNRESLDKESSNRAKVGIDPTRSLQVDWGGLCEEIPFFV